MSATVFSISFYRDFLLREAFDGQKSAENFVPIDHILGPLYRFMEKARARAGFADKVTKALFPPNDKSFTFAHKLFNAVLFARFCSMKERERLLRGCIQAASPNHYEKVLSFLKRRPCEEEIRAMAAQREGFRMKERIVILAAGISQKLASEISEVLARQERYYMESE